ncbi:MAG: VOC family protein [Actinobacteria bacterium]|nr:VOC family protein [Actinomycetota bacterium]
MSNTIVWADIPVTDMDRARTFYAAVLQAEIPLMDGANGDVALLPMERGEASGDLVRSENQKPGLTGVTIYLDSKGDPEGMIARAAAAGGKVLTPVANMGDMVGSIGYFADSEGNRIGVHKPPQG